MTCNDYFTPQQLASESFCNRVVKLWCELTLRLARLPSVFVCLHTIIPKCPDQNVEFLSVYLPVFLFLSVSECAVTTTPKLVLVCVQSLPQRRRTVCSFQSRRSMTTIPSFPSRVVEMQLVLAVLFISTTAAWTCSKTSCSNSTPTVVPKTSSLGACMHTIFVFNFDAFPRMFHHSLVQTFSRQ